MSPTKIKKYNKMFINQDILLFEIYFQYWNSTEFYLVQAKMLKNIFIFMKINKNNTLYF